MVTKFQAQIKLTIRIAVTLLVLATLISAVDVISDVRHGVSLSHVLIEVTIMITTIVTTILLIRAGHVTAHDSLRKIKQSIFEAESESIFWKKRNVELAKGVSLRVSEQFKKWDLTPSETEVGFLLIKGLSFKEIAFLRKTSEKTVREQASSVYKKSKLSGRNELASFFIEDLLATHT